MNLYFILFPIIFLLIFGCQPKTQPPYEKHSENKLLMGTTVKLDVCYKEEQSPQLTEAFEKVWERLGDIHWRMSIFDEKSDVHKVNQSFSDSKRIGNDTFQLIKEAERISKMTNGVFDITVWPLIKLWKEKEKENQLPTQDELKKVRMAVGFHQISFQKNNRIKILHPETKIDLGGIAKGYAIDEAVRIFRSYGLNNFLIDAGGDLYAGGRNCEDQLWRIGIRDPRDVSKMIDVVSVINAAVATSGDYQQYFAIQGQRWSHIINPKTGLPQTGVISATVIGPNAARADAFATALTILDGEKGISFIESLEEDFSALIFIQNEEDEVIRYETNSYRRLKKDD